MVFVLIGLWIIFVGYLVLRDASPPRPTGPQHTAVIRETPPPPPQREESVVLRPRIVQQRELATLPPPPSPTAAPVRPETVYRQVGFQETNRDFPFYVAEKRWNREAQRYDFYRQGMHGTEVQLLTDARRHIQSESQGDYPEPESGCGPTALLNLYLWYTKYGLIKETIRHSDPKRYKQLKFQQIDRKIRDIQRQSRTRAGGTNTLQLIVALDEIMKDSGNQDTRIHFEIKNSPLETHDFLNITRGYRSGILSVRPFDKRRGTLGGNHAVLVIAGDWSGRVTLANWGGYTNGRLVMRDGQQWFIAEEEDQPDFLIRRLTTLIPFKPS